MLTLPHIVIGVDDMRMLVSRLATLEHAAMSVVKKV